GPRPGSQSRSVAMKTKLLWSTGLGAACGLFLAAAPASAAVIFNFAEVSASTEASLRSSAKDAQTSQSDSSSTLPAAGLDSGLVTSTLASGASSASASAEAIATF